MSVRRWGRRWGGLAVTAALFAVIAGVAVVAFEPWEVVQGGSSVGAPGPEQTAEGPDMRMLAPPASAVAVATLQSPPDSTAKLQDSLPAASEAEPAFEDVELEAPYLILDGFNFTAGRWAITLRDVMAPSRDAVCLDREGLLFACGLQARAALNNMLRKGKATCNVRRPATYGRFESACQVADGDLAELLVAHGWARPIPEAGDRLAAAMEKARKAQLGVWNGGWKIRSAEKP